MSEQRAYYKLDALDLNIQSGDFVVTSFEDVTGSKSTEWSAPGASMDGRTRGDVSYPNKVFNIGLSIRVQGDTSTLDSVLRTLYEKIIEVDEQDETPVWFYHRPVADTSWTEIRRIKVLGAECKIPADQRAWKARVIDGIQLVLECEEGWRANSETELVSATVIKTTYDDVVDNYVDIGTPGIAGDLPALCRIAVASTDGNYTSWKIGVGVGKIMEWEDTGGATAADGDASHWAFLLADTGTTWQDAGALSMLASGNYGLYRVFARVKDMASVGGKAYIRMRWGIASTLVINSDPDTDIEVIEDGVQIKPARHSGVVPSQIWVDVPLGTVDFRESKWKINSTDPRYFSIRLDTKRTAGVDAIYIDRLYFMPLDLGFCWVGRSQGVAETGQTMFLSSIEDRAYITDGTYIRGTPSLDGGIIKLPPVAAGSTRFIQFLWDEDTDPDLTSVPPKSLIYSGAAYRTATITVDIVERYL